MGTCRKRLPRRVLAERFLDDVTFVERSFDFFKGKRLQAWDIVLEGDLRFELDVCGSVAIILP